MNQSPPWSRVTRMLACFCLVACVEASAPRDDASPIDVPDAGSRVGEDMMHQASEYLRVRSQAWLESRDCAISCHTTLPFLMTDPLETPASRDLADALQERVAARVVDWPDVNHFYPSQPLATEAVLNAVALVYYDLKVTQALSPVTCDAVEAAWAVQEEDGSFGWWSFNLQPFEVAKSNVWAGAMLSIAVARAQDALTVAASNCDALGDAHPGLIALHAWLVTQVTATDGHGRSWILWADQAWNHSLLSPDSRDAIFDELRSNQRDDGGFGLLDFLPRSPASQSDAYMSSLAGMLLRAAPEGANLETLGKLDAWMLANGSMPQLENVTSPNKPGVDRNDAFFTDTAVAYWMLYTAHQDDSK